MARYVGVILLAALIAWAGNALGACAWVLWEEMEYAPLPIPPGAKEWPSKSWKLHVARQTQAECEDVLAKTWQVTLEHSQPGPDKPGIKGVKSAPGYISVTYQTKDGDSAGGSSYTFRCFPDTIDPRAPKAAK